MCDLALVVVEPVDRDLLEPAPDPLDVPAQRLAGLEALDPLGLAYLGRSTG